MDTPWEEALDLHDSHSDSDHNTQQTAAPSANSLPLSQPFLRRCSSHRPLQPSSSSSPCPIPGPAGIMQAAIHRRNDKKTIEISMGLVEEHPIPTQEYLKRAVEDNAADDDDFTRYPWLSALDFVRRQGLVDGDGAIGIPLSAIKSRVNVDKVSQVVAIVKSCTPNGLGGMMVTLKDPTGTIDASIHHKVIAEKEFGKDISNGAVIIIQKVALFSPSRSARYLNITLGNVVKVISTSGRTPLQENCSSSMVGYAAPGAEHSEKSWMPQKAFSFSQGRTQGIMNSLRQNANQTETAQNDEQMLVDKVVGHNCCSDGRKRNRNDVFGKEHLLVRQDAAIQTIEVSQGKKTGNMKQLKPENQKSRGNMLEGAQCHHALEDLAEAPSNQEKNNNNGTMNKQLPNLRASLPQWTDEQLDELFAFD